LKTSELFRLITQIWKYNAE